MEHGVDCSSIYLQLYSSELSSVLLRASFLSKIKVFENSSVAYIYNTKEELEALGISDIFSVSRGMVNVMADIKGIDIWVNFTEDGEKVMFEQIQYQSRRYGARRRRSSESLRLRRCRP